MDTLIGALSPQTQPSNRYSVTQSLMEITIPMRATTIAFALLIAAGSTTFAQNPSADEKAIRDIVAKMDAGERIPGGLALPDSVGWSGATVKPVVGNEKPQFRPGSSAGGGRTNEMRATQIVQLHIAASGDVAYDHGTFKSSWVRTDNKQKIELEGAYLRVWRKVAGSWKIAATFQRPYDDTPTTK